MPKLPADKQKRIRALIFGKADQFGYATSGRIENGRFLDQLVNDPEIGGVLKEDMEKERVRTYIKDAVLNAYTKRLTRNALTQSTPESIIHAVYNVEASKIQEVENVTVLRAANGVLYVLSSGRVLKWETALKKALELIARQPGMLSNDEKPEICLQLAMLSSSLTESEKEHILTALSIIGVRAVFCGD